MLFPNPHAARQPYPDPLRQILDIERGRESQRWLQGWDRLLPGPTPLRALPGLARQLGIAQLWLKDEAVRSPLGSFKALGAPIALLRLILRRWPAQGWQAPDLLAGHHADALRDFTVISATDGNHGRALAAAAHSVGCRCVIVLHAQVSAERADPIAALGAEIVRIAGNYDESVREATRLAAANGWHVVSDTSYEGYEAVPRDVMQGYAIIADEVLDRFAPEAASPFTHVILQGGVGGFAAGVVSHFLERYGAARPSFIVVEPGQADCLLQSARAAFPTRASGSVDSVMAGLACGETSPLAWRFLHDSVDLFMTVDDDDAVHAMRTLAEGGAGDVPVVSGESGAVGLAALQVLARDPALARQAGLDSGSRLLLVNTEGATAPGLYQALTGRSAEAVRAAQQAHTARTDPAHGPAP